LERRLSFEPITSDMMEVIRGKKEDEVEEEKEEEEFPI
jgi:hypothetical protein